MRRKLDRLAEKRQAKVWKKRWQESPELMERARAKATLAAKRRWQEKNESLKQIVQGWPMTISKEELDAIISRVYPGHRNPRSLLNRLRRLGFIRYDLLSGYWLNLCHLESPWSGN